MRFSLRLLARQHFGSALRSTGPVPSGPWHTSALGPSPGLAEIDWGFLFRSVLWLSHTAAFLRRGPSLTVVSLQICGLHFYIYSLAPMYLVSLGAQYTGIRMQAPIQTKPPFWGIVWERSYNTPALRGDQSGILFNLSP